MDRKDAFKLLYAYRRAVRNADYMERNFPPCRERTRAEELEQELESKVMLALTGSAS